MRIFYRISCVLLIVGLFGCRAAVKINEGENNLDIRTVMQKVTTTDVSKVESDTECNAVGVVINISNYLEMNYLKYIIKTDRQELAVNRKRTEEDAYREVSDKIISMFKAVNINAFVVHNENDSRLKNVCYLLHVCYDEEPKNRWLTSAVSDASIDRLGRPFSESDIDGLIYRNYYNVAVIDVKRGKEKHNYNNLETALYAIKNMLQK